jgi:hypothetical protein
MQKLSEYAMTVEAAEILGASRTHCACRDSRVYARNGAAESLNPRMDSLYNIGSNCNHNKTHDTLARADDKLTQSNRFGGRT